MERWHSSVTMKSKVSIGSLGLYSTGTGSACRLAMVNADSSSSAGSSCSSPFSME